MQPPGTGRFDRRRLLFGSLAVLVAAGCFGTLGPISRLTYDGGLEPLGFVAWRSGIGGLVLAIYFVLRVGRGGDRWVPFGSLPRRALANLAAATISGVVLNLAMFVAFGRMTVALVLLSFYTYPVMVAFVDAVIRREPLGRPTIGALVLAVGGMGLVVSGGLGTAGGIRIDPLALFLAFLAAASQVVFISVSRAGYRAVPTLQAMTTILLGDAVAFVVIAIALGQAAQVAGPFLHPGTWGLLLLAGVPAAGISSALYLTGIRWIGGVRTGILALFEPVVGVVLAALVLSEAIGPLQVLGGALVLAAAVVLQVASAPPAHGLPAAPAGETVPTV